MSSKQKPFITRIEVEGTTADRQLTSKELRRRVITFNGRLEKYPLQMRLDALNKVIDKVRDDPTELDFLKALLATGEWNKEVKVLLGQQERLEVLRRLK